MIHQALSPGGVDWLLPLILLHVVRSPCITIQCIVIHGDQFTDGVHPPNQFVPEIVSHFPCSPALVRHILLIVYFFYQRTYFFHWLP